MIAVYDVDDLWNEGQIEEYLCPIKERVPNWVVTAYAIPNKLGPVHALKEKYPWVLFAIHGWEHTQFECREWTDEKAERILKKALEMGYSPLFKAPNWTMDKETEWACWRLGIVLHHHVDYKPSVSGLRCFPGVKPDKHIYKNVHTHIQKNPVTDFISTHPGFSELKPGDFEQYSTPLDFAIAIGEMDDERLASEASKEVAEGSSPTRLGDQH